MAQVLQQPAPGRRIARSIMGRIVRRARRRSIDLLSRNEVQDLDLGWWLRMALVLFTAIS